MTKPHKHIRWTSLEIKRLTQLVHEGKANRQIAEILERSLNSIIGQRRRLRLITKPHKLNHRDPKLIAQVIKFRMAGWQSKEVAEIFGVKTAFYRKDNSTCWAFQTPAFQKTVQKAVATMDRH